MVHQQIQQIQQRINNVSQMASQMRQAEESNRQRLMQLAQEEAFAAQQMNRIQQLCQESISALQSISYGTTVPQGQQSYLSSAPPVYGQGYGTGVTSGVGTTSPIQQNPGALFNLASMSPDTYENVMQHMGVQGGGISTSMGMQGSGMTGMSGSMQSGGISGTTGQFGTIGQGAQSTLSDISTMGPSVYLSSREQLGKGSTSLNQIGQQAGITSQTNPQSGQMTGFTGTTKLYNQ